eukprot:CAMPEP_0177584048 /NCGR_PEP_ID=MMETSP0419_2-20121207/3676_1 /TAXON_ID=582737 /ORGANISM="Tetraselmis sp., Strain GSL018" /LENGTH=120 /DNA_ID=CAMNT_0019073537 /DNA_START=100 /DNA_END=462 /DNA_ORIENTATION=+
MVREVHRATGDDGLLREALAALRLEHRYFLRKHVRVALPGGEPRPLARYLAEWDRPRPESHREDVETSSLATGRDQRELYRDIASAAESGWDFSSRWLADGDSRGFLPVGSSVSQPHSGG